MNISPFKKQIQKLFLLSAIILVTISIFPVINEVKEAGAQIRGPSGGCNISTSDLINPVLRLSKARVGYEESFDAYYEGTLSASKAAECKESGKDGYEVSILVYNADGAGGCTFSAVSNLRRSYSLSFFESGGQAGFRTRINGISLKSTFSGTTVDDAGDVNCVYFYLHPKNTTDYRGYVQWNGHIQVNGRYPFSEDGYFEKVASTSNPITDNLPQIPETQNAGDTTVDNTQSILASRIAVSFTKSSNGAGLRDKYRVVATDRDMIFGTTVGLDAITLDWANGAPKIGFNQYIALSQRNDYTFLPQQDPQFKYLNVYFADGSTSWSGNKSCEGGLIANDGCSNLVFTAPNNSKGEGDSSASSKQGLQNPYKPTLKSAAWSQFSGGSSSDGKPLGSASFYVIPVLWGRTGVTLTEYAYVLGKTPPKFTVEVYASETDLINACKAELEDDNLCTASYARFGIGKVLESSTGSSETDAQTTTQSLYSFIVKVISSIVIFLTSTIYRIFAYFVVPVINALLSVRPYQDAFVNLIYPGWLILRNLANIFFIIALLVVGLRILFQQSAAGAARGFIMRLIIMALLVNFSLVVAQGVVGIADTVQSQFLPGDTRVIEALGTKLMVDPIISFRNAVGGGDVGGAIQGDANVGDIAKPIVLLMLAVAAFFSFLAIAAFLAVRLVMLMILYMASPVAYVGYVMDETKGYAKQWWNEFIKYAFLTPILVFFLNIAALVATATSANNGNIFDMETDGLSAELVSGGLTIISHFIVLLIIFVGMKVALRSGTMGAQTIVKYAQKGFKNTFKKPAEWLGSGAKGAGMWAKDFAGDTASGFAQDKGYGKTAAAISALTQPAITAKGLRTKFFDEPKKKQQERLAGRREGLEKFVSNVGNNKWQATKMAAWKLRGKGAEFFRDQAGKLRDIKTDAEIKNIKADRAKNQSILNDVQERLVDKDNRYITKAEGENYSKKLAEEIENLPAEKTKAINDLIKEKGEAIALGNRGRVASIEDEINQTNKDYDTKLASAKAAKDDIDDRLSRLLPDTAYTTTFKMEDRDSAVKALEINSEMVKANIEKLDGDLSRDEMIRKGYGFQGQVIDDDKKKLIIKQAEELESIAAKREFPTSPGDVSARLKNENEEGKKYDGIEDQETLRVAFEGAMKKNNMDAAAAIAKKLSKEGGFADLLKEHGYNNNVEDFKKFMDEKFQDTPVVVRNQIASEISYLNGQNGNRALASATKIGSDRVVRFNSIEEQQSKIAKSAAKKPLWDRKKSDLTYQDSNGKFKFNAGELEDINNSTDKKLQEFDKRLKPDLAMHILTTADEQGVTIRDKVRTALNKIINPEENDTGTTESN